MNHKNPRILSNFRKLPKEGTSLCSTPKEKRSRRKSTERRASDGEIVMEVGWRGRGWRPVGSKQAFFTPPRTRERDQASLRFTRVYAGPRTPAYLLITQPLSSSHPSPTRQLPSQEVSLKISKCGASRSLHLAWNTFPAPFHRVLFIL